MKKFYFFCFSLSFFMTACHKYPLHLTHITVNEKLLASYFVQTKDPRKKDPLNGEELIISWALKRSDWKRAKYLILDIIYKNFEQERVWIPVERKTDMQAFFVLGEKYKKTKGILTYQAQIVTEDNKLLVLWAQKMWFNVLKMLDVQENESELSLEALPLF